MTNNAEVMYDTRHPPPNRSRIFLGDGFTKKEVDFIGKTNNLIFHSYTDVPATLYDVSVVPGLEFDLVSFHNIRENNDITLNKSGAPLMDGRLTFSRKDNGSYGCATRVLLRQNVKRSIVLVNVEGHQPPPPSAFAPSTLLHCCSPLSIEPNEYGVTKKKSSFAATRASVKKCCFWGNYGRI